MLLQDLPRHDDCFGIPLGVMQPGTASPVDLYIDFGVQGQLVLYKKAGEPLSEDTRDRLLERGVTTLFLSKKDERAYHEYVESNIEAIIRDDLMPPGEVSRLVYETSAHVMGDVFKDPRSGSHLRRARRMVEATVMTVLKDPQALWCMTSVASHDYYTYTHCVNVSMFMTAAAREILDITNPTDLKAVGLGGMFHDIGKSEIPEEILSKPGKLTAEEFEIIKSHPIKGVELVTRNQKFSETALKIVRHHHERFEGGGYPTSGRGADMPSVVRLATIVDVYDALTTNRSYAPARSPYDALQLMMEKMGGHFDDGLLRAFVRFLGPRQVAQKEERAAVGGAAQG